MNKVFSQPRTLSACDLDAAVHEALQRVAATELCAEELTTVSGGLPIIDRDIILAGYFPRNIVVA